MHTHVIPAESLTDAPDDRARHAQALLLQHEGVRRMLTSHRNAQAQSPANTTAHPVYVIDDDANLRRSLGRLLRVSNWQAHTFDSAESFLAALNGLSRGCVLVDIQLPGISGLALIGRLKDARPSWPIIAMSGSPDETTESEALRLGARGFLHKPFASEPLLALIARHVAASERSRAGAKVDACGIMVNGTPRTCSASPQNYG
jgi:two-component system response regulator FixJ